MLPGDSYLHSMTPAECADIDTLRSLLSVFDRSASSSASSSSTSHSASSPPHGSRGGRLGGSGTNGSNRGTSPPTDSVLGQPERDDTTRDDTLLSASELAAKYSQGPHPTAGDARDTMRDDTLLSASELAAKYSQGPHPTAGAARGSSRSLSASMPTQPPLHPSLDLSDAVLLRFLRATHGDIHAALDRWTTTFQWRLDFAVDTLLGEA